MMFEKLCTMENPDVERTLQGKSNSNSKMGVASTPEGGRDGQRPGIKVGTNQPTSQEIAANICQVVSDVARTCLNTQ